jgi:tetratricopeptide (TPR) repeat protein
MVVFVSRLDELQGIARLGAGSERALLLVGEMGAGKTSLLLEAARAQPGFLYVPAAYDASAGPLSGLHMLLDAIGGAVAAELTETLLACSRRGTSAFDTTTALLGIARRVKLQPALLLLDDVDRLDADSQHVLGHFVRRMSGVGWGIVLSMESVDPDGPFSGMDVLRLGPLDAMDSLSLARSLAPHRTDEAVLRATALAGNGSPLAIKEALGLLGRGACDGREPLVLPLRAGVRTAGRVDVEFGLLGEDARTTAEVLSCAPRMDLRVHRRMFGDGNEALGELILAGLAVQDGRHASLARPDVRSAIYWGQEPETRRRRHRVLAEEHAGVGDGATAMWHRNLIEPTGDGGSELVQAAIALIDAGEALMGIEYLELARQLNDIPPSLADLFGTAAKGLFLRGEFAFAFRYLQFATVFGTDACRMEREALSLCMAPHTSSVVSVHAALAFAEEFGPGHPERVGQVLGYCAFHFAERLELEEASALIDVVRRLPLGDGSDAAMLLGLAEQLLLAMNGRHHRAREEFRRVASAATARSTHIASVLAGRVLTHAEEYQQAARLFDAVLRSHEVAPYWSEKARLYLADNEYRAGRLRRALAEAGAVVRSCTDPLVHRSLRLLLANWYWQTEGASGRAQALAEETAGSRQ